MIIATTRQFVREELVPHERELEDTGVLRPELQRELKTKAIAAGLYAANMPTEVGGTGLDAVSWALYEKELGYTSYALHFGCVARPSNILLACAGEQRQRYLLPAVRGERTECLAMTEPGAGSDLRGMKTTAVESGGDFIINGTKHFISHADHSDFVILFAATRRGGRDRAAPASRSPRSWSTWAPPDSKCGPATRTSRTAATPTACCSSPIAACRSRRCSGSCTAGSRWPTPGWAPRGCRWRRTASGAPSGRSSSPSNGRSTGCSSASRSASSRAWPSSSRTWRWSCGRQSC